MHCPSCKQPTTLEPTKLTSNLSARKCPECQGVLIDLLSYRAWREKWQRSEVAPGATVAEVADSSKALLCPKCSGVMLKFRIGSGMRNTIDVCVHCDSAWLDEGEWELLGALALQSKLTNIFTEPWQRKLRAEQAERHRLEQDLALIGSDAMARLDDLASWLEDHPRREEVFRVLRRRFC